MWARSLWGLEDHLFVIPEVLNREFRVFKTFWIPDQARNDEKMGELL